MADLDLDALSTTLTVVKGGVTYTLVPNMSANEAEAWFDEKTTDRSVMAKAMITKAALPHHKTMTPEKVGSIFTLPEMASIVHAFLVPPGPAKAAVPTASTRQAKTTRKPSPRKQPAR